MRLAGVLLLASVLACSDSTRSTAPEQAALGGEVAARVGTDIIPVSLVAKVAADQQIAPREALRRLIDDAVSANGARARGLDRERPSSWLLTAARSRWAADHIMTEARQAGPPTDAEIAELTRLHWREVDRPAAVRVVHALVQHKQPGQAAAAQAHALAEEIRAAVLSARDADDFQAKAKAVPHPADLDVIVQPLPPFANDGALTEAEGNPMMEPFARPAHTLTHAGETSGVVETPFGSHVIRLVERIPEQRMPLEARRAAFGEETFMQRARKATDARLAALRTTAPVELMPSSERLMETLLDRGPAP
jgi:peptidyl-prolyl cis-trans isomerase C